MKCNFFSFTVLQFHISRFRNVQKKWTKQKSKQHDLSAKSSRLFLRKVLICFHCLYWICTWLSFSHLLRAPCRRWRRSPALLILACIPWQLTTFLADCCQLICCISWLTSFSFGQLCRYAKNCIPWLTAHWELNC